MPYFIGKILMRYGVGPHPDIISLQVRLHIQDPNNDLGEDYLMQSARHTFNGCYLAKLDDIFAPELCQVLNVEVIPAGPPDDNTQAPAEN